MLTGVLKVSLRVHFYKKHRQLVQNNGQVQKNLLYLHNKLTSLWRLL